MSRDVLARARRNGLSMARFRLGQYVFREPDYRQILDWAETLQQKPEWVLEQLEDSRLEPEEWEIGNRSPLSLKMARFAAWC
jgi:hypothetical protein